MFKEGTSFIYIKRLYEFDRQLRLLLLDAVERIEIAILRTQLVEFLTLTYGPFGYVSSNSYNPKFPKAKFRKLLGEIKQDETRSYEEFVKRYRSKYTSEKYLPFWMAVEVMSFGQLFTVYRNADPNVKRKIAAVFGVYPPVLDSWLHTLNYIRNACAHHVRLWNRLLPVAPMFPDKKHDPDWYTPQKIRNNKIFAVLTISQYLLYHIGFDCYWKSSLLTLIANNPEVPISIMGFPNNWLEIKIWK
jgi:abortive infection bacteriophage resistance protein